MKRLPGWTALLCACARLHAGEVILGPSADTTLIETAPANNLGSQTFFNAGAAAIGTSSVNRGLMKFDVAASLPPLARINSVTLLLNVTGEPSAGGKESNFKIYRVLRAWGEGTKLASFGAPGIGFAATEGEATWNSRMHAQQSWSVPGGAFGVDFAPEPRSEQWVYGVGDSPYVFEGNPGMIADVQSWLENPVDNFGWALISDSEDVQKTARRFASREDFANQPQLHITFQAPPVIQALQLAEGKIKFQFQSEAGLTYEVLSATNLSTTLWTVSATYPATDANQNYTFEETAIDAARFYRVHARP